MICERASGLPSLLRQRTGAQIAGEAIFEDDPAIRERFRQRKIVHHGDAVADSLGAQNFHRFANRFRRRQFPPRGRRCAALRRARNRMRDEN